MGKITKALKKASRDRNLRANFLSGSSVDRNQPIRNMEEGQIIGSWFVWVFLIGLIVVVFIAFNINKGKDAVPLTEIFPDEEVQPIDVEYEFVDKQGAIKQLIEPEPQVVKAVVEEQEAVAVKVEEVVKEVKEAVVEYKEPVKTVTKDELAKVSYTIQVASFKDEKKAGLKLDEALKKDYPAFIASRDLGERGIWYRVYVGQFETKAEAESYLSKVKTDYSDSFIIVPKK